MNKIQKAIATLHYDFKLGLSEMLECGACKRRVYWVTILGGGKTTLNE